MIPSIKTVEENKYVIKEDKKSLIYVKSWIKNLKFDDFYCCEEKCAVTMRNLQYSQLGVSTRGSANWENRKHFITTVIKDIFTNCPKNKPLTFISQGSDALLIEYVIAANLTNAKFSHLNFIFIDALYGFANKQMSENIKIEHKEFRDRISSISDKNFNAERRIQFLHTTKLLKAYFQRDSNVVLIDCLPPYAHPLNELKIQGEVIKKEDILSTNFVVPNSKMANAVAIYPEDIYEEIVKKREEELGTRYLPIHFIEKLGKDFIFDWGCKIYSNGSYRLLFNGEADYYDVLTTKDEKRASTLKEKVVSFKNCIKESLDKKIQEIKDKTLDSKLSHLNTQKLIETVDQVAKEHSFKTIFIDDYTMRQEEMISFLAENAGKDYRKIFRHVDEGKDLVIKQDEIK